MVTGVSTTRFLPAAGRVELVPRAWYNPDLRSRWFYIPAILAMVLMLTTMVMPSMAVVREKEIGTLEQLIVTPVRPWQLIVGKLFPFAVIGLATTLLVTALSVLGFGVPLRGSLLLLVFLTALFLLSTLGLGLLASTLAGNQQQAMMASIFLLMMPMIYLSGLIFPIENMPRLIRIGTYGIPLRYYNTIIRGIFLKGVGLETLWPQAVVLLAYGLGILGLASMRFRKRLD
jgi:ABC-2 type transport system permease protein